MLNHFFLLDFPNSSVRSMPQHSLRIRVQSVSRAHKPPWQPRLWLPTVCPLPFPHYSPTCRGSHTMALKPSLNDRNLIHSYPLNSKKKKITHTRMRCYQINHLQLENVWKPLNSNPNQNRKMNFFLLTQN